MADRLTTITTRGGDGGETSLGDGSRVPKHSLRIAALGDVDELNSQLGVVLTHPLPADAVDCLQRVQHDLFDLGGELCIPGHLAISDAQLERLEAAVASFNAVLSPLAEFILPGGSPAAAHLHVARCICRRAERTLVALDKEEVLPATGIRYLNRLSDVLFVMARIANRHVGVTDVLWQPGLNR